LRKRFAFLAGNDGLMHLSERKHVLDHAAIDITRAPKRKCPGQARA
jgi:hypothetical protein